LYRDFFPAFPSFIINLLIPVPILESCGINVPVAFLL
jgi:hypothetical protein